MKSEVFPEHELEIVLGALRPTNRLVIKTALHTGLRIGDVLALKPGQLAPRFYIREQKTKKKRVVGLPAELLRELRAQSGENWVFPGRDPEKHRTRQAVWADVKRVARALRMPQNVSPHSMRKLYAVRLYRKYGDLDRVRRSLNHDDVATTLIYAMADRLQERL